MVEVLSTYGGSFDINALSNHPASAHTPYTPSAPLSYPNEEQVHSNTFEARYPIGPRSGRVPPPSINMGMRGGVVPTSAAHMGGRGGYPMVRGGPHLRGGMSPYHQFRGF